MSSAPSNQSATISMPKNLLEHLDGTVWMNVLRLLIAANTLGTNAFLLILFARFKKLRKNLCNQLILLNATMDFISGTGPAVRACFQFYLMHGNIEQFSKLACILVAFPYNFGYSCSQITFIGLSIDRLKAIARPLSYMGDNKRKFAMFIGMVAIFFGILSIVIIFIGLDVRTPSRQCSIAINSGPFYSIYWTAFMGISTLIVTINYCTLLIMYFKRKSSTQSVAAYKGKENGQQAEEVKNRKEMKLTTTIALILLIYIISWAIPTAIWLTFLLHDADDRMRMNYVSYSQGYVTAAGCGFNLYIYLLKHAEIRRCAFRMVWWSAAQKEAKWAKSVNNNNTAEPNWRNELANVNNKTM